MNEETVKELRQQHFDNYKKAIIDNITNNTNMLYDDILLLIEKPPLDSMDLIKSKFFDSAKKNKIVLNSEELDKILHNYRKMIVKNCDKIKKIRFDSLNKLIDKFKLVKDDDTFILYKKDFISLNKNIKKIMKDSLMISFEKEILKHFNKIFGEDVNDGIKEKILKDISNYLKGSYQRQLLENFDIKVLVKDTTLINGVKEQTERYIFTLNNSRLLNDPNILD